MLQGDVGIVPDDYQPDEQLSDSTPWTSIGEDIDNLAQIRKKAAKWCDVELMQMAICMGAHLMDHSLTEENKKKQSSIKHFLQWTFK